MHIYMVVVAGRKRSSVSVSLHVLNAYMFMYILMSVYIIYIHVCMLKRICMVYICMYIYIIYMLIYIIYRHTCV